MKARAGEAGAERAKWWKWKIEVAVEQRAAGADGLEWREMAGSGMMPGSPNWRMERSRNSGGSRKAGSGAEANPGSGSGGSGDPELAEEREPALKLIKIIYIAVN